MGNFFLFLLIIFFAIVGFIGILVLKFVRFFTKQTSGFNNGRSTYSNGYNDQQNRQQPNENNHSKVFSKEEGEYVDYEEIK